MTRPSVQATATERERPLPGDDLIPDAQGSLTHAITINRPPRDVWPWLAQMGAGSRAGWYSYDWIDNGRRPSAARLVPELQQLTAGMVFPALPGRTDGFTLMSFEPARWLVLAWLGPYGKAMSTWAFMLEEIGPGATRLVTRARGPRDYRFLGLPPWPSQQIIRFVHFVMERRQLLGIAERAAA